jgi:23S rRNA (adenine2503-C2)-methyltransferase
LGTTHIPPDAGPWVRGPGVQSLTDMNEAAMEQLAASMDEPAFRGRQLFNWVHGRLETDFGRMTNLPRAFLGRLAERFPVARAVLEAELASADGDTHKRLLRLADGQTLEAVLMQAPAPARAEDRFTVCVSSQAGCALGCTFCVTGQVGFSRQLSAGEIVEQVYHFERELRGSLDGHDPRHRAVTNVVFMGMGEPMANYNSVVAAIRLLISPDGFGLGARRITVSTAGIVPGIERLAGEGLQLGLAISLHAPDDEVRSRIMPINRRYPIAEVLRAADDYSASTGRRVSYEYAMMDGVNDSPARAKQLGQLLAGRLCHVNLIPLNRSLDPSLQPSSHERILAFQRIVEGAHVPCTVRRTKGQDILAACGQLRYTATTK